MNLPKHGYAASRVDQPFDPPRRRPAATDYDGFFAFEVQKYRQTFHALMVVGISTRRSQPRRWTAGA